MDGPYIVKMRGGPRRLIIFKLANGRKTSMTWARWLMTQHLDRRLARDEHVDHVNNNPLDDRIDNLQILTPKDNIRKSSMKNWEPALIGTDPEPRRCSTCAKLISKGGLSGQCKSCNQRGKFTKTNWPNVEELISLLHTGHSYSSLGRILGVSDNAIRKHFRSHGIEPPRRNRPPVPE